MKIKHGIKVSVLALSVLGLAACSSMHHGAGNEAGVTDATANGAGADGAGAQGAYAQGAGADGSSFSSETANCNPPQRAGYAENAYYFDFDQSDVHSEYMNSLQSLSQYFASNPNAKLELYGNTDVRGSPAYNQALGERRANAVAAVLKQYGVSNPISVVSYGAEKPISSGTSDQDYQCNRRVDLQYRKD